MTAAMTWARRGRPRALALAALALALLAPAVAAGAPRWLAPQALAPAGILVAPRVALGAQGHALAAWAAQASPPGAWRIVVSARADGAAAWGPPAAISAPAFVQMGQLALDPAGGAAAIWTTAPGSETAVAQVAVRPAGSEAFEPPQDLSPPSAFAFAPRLAAEGHGAIVAVWEERAAGRIGSGVVMSAVRPAGAAAFGPAEALSQPGEEASQPDVAVDAAGNAVAVWAAGPPGAARVVRARLRAAGAGAWDGPVTISSTASGIASARVAMDPAGAVVAAWTASRDGVGSLETASRPPGGPWDAPEALGPAASAVVEAPTVLAGADGVATLVYLRWDGTARRLAARSRVGGGAWSAPQDLSPGGASVEPLAFSGGGRAALGPGGAVVAVWSRAFALVEAAVKPAGAAAFDPAATVSALGQYAHGPAIAVGPDGEALAAWTQGPSPMGAAAVLQTADLTSRPGLVLEPPAVQITAGGAPLRAPAGTIVRLTATFASPVDRVPLVVQRGVAGTFADAGPPSLASGVSGTVAVRLSRGVNALRIAYADRGAPSFTAPVTTIGTPPGRALIPAGVRPVAVRVGLGAVWVLSRDDEGQSSVVRIDPRSRRPVGDPIPVGRASGLAVGAGAVWAAGPPGGSPGLRRIDPAAMTVTAELPVETTGSVAVGGGAVWTVECGRDGAVDETDCGRQRLLMLDPRTTGVARAVEVVAPLADENPQADVLAADARGAWLRIATDDSSGVIRYERMGDTLVRGAPLGIASGAFAVGAGGVWTVGGKRCLVSRATAGGRPIGRPRRILASAGYSCAGGVVTSGRDLWIGQAASSTAGSFPTPAAPARIARIDARTGKLVGIPIELGRGPAAFAVGADAVWVAYPETGVVVRIDPRKAARARPRPNRPPTVTIVRGAWSAP
ncbi:MAG: hypothetical protein QOK40_1154, partial [Miltoncostaeaceae bacterium]|nr:hypothetical protein [Miltoncostaeaceae bacterium]